MAEKIYEILIRFHEDGRIGAHAEYLDLEKRTSRVVPIDTADFPALVKTKLADILSDHNAELLGVLDAQRRELEALKSADQTQIPIEETKPAETLLSKLTFGILK